MLQFQVYYIHSSEVMSQYRFYIEFDVQYFNFNISTFDILLHKIYAPLCTDGCKHFSIKSSSLSLQFYTNMNRLIHFRVPVLVKASPSVSIRYFYLDNENFSFFCGLLAELEKAISINSQEQTCNTSTLLFHINLNANRQVLNQ